MANRKTVEKTAAQLELAQVRATFVAARDRVRTLKALVKQEREDRKVAKAAAKVAKAAALSDKRAARVAKLQAKLNALMTPQAIKRRNRKAGPVVTIKQAVAESKAA